MYTVWQQKGLRVQATEALPCKGQVKASGRIGGCRPKKQLEEAALKKRKQISPKITLNKTTQAHHVHGEVEIRGHNLL